MTAPLTPPHQPSSNDPWQTPPSAGGPGGSHLIGAHGPGGLPGAPEEKALAPELRPAALVALLVTVSGVALGLLWLWLAPRVPLISDSTAVFLNDSEGEEAIGADGTFVLLGLAFGAVSAALVFWFRRRGGIALVVALALGGLLGSLLAWRLGVWLGPTQDVVAHARAVGKGVVFDAPLQLRAKGALLAWPLGAMAVHLALTALFGPRDPEPEWGVFPGGPWAPGAAVFGGPGAGTPGAPDAGGSGGSGTAGEPGAGGPAGGGVPPTRP
ncbi:ABC transporter permease [Streptomyces sp. NPDC057697]|uniref:ABC transporter permease n=1 Tax=Streptomyces sp. NPDC057697 TaxID=3346219 RepID=UPI00367B1687